LFYSKVNNEVVALSAEDGQKDGAVDDPKGKTGKQSKIGKSRSPSTKKPETPVKSPKGGKAKKNVKEEASAAPGFYLLRFKNS
jgi:hypothetical protein